MTGHDIEGPAVGNTVVATEQKRPRSGKRATVERHMDDALSTLKFTAIAESRSTHAEFAEGALDVELGIAFVAGALGKKVPAVLPNPILTAPMPYCYVEIILTKKKAKAAEIAAPPNSVESEDLGMLDDMSVARLSQSDVQVGFPEEVTGVLAVTGPAPSMEVPTISTTQKGGEVYAPAAVILDVAANEEVVDEPPAPGYVATPVSINTSLREENERRPESRQGPLTGRVLPGSGEEALAMKNKYDNGLRMI